MYLREEYAIIVMDLDVFLATNALDKEAGALACFTHSVGHVAARAHISVVCVTELGKENKIIIIS